MSIKIYNDPKLHQLYDLQKTQKTGKAMNKGNGNVDQVNFSSTLQEVQHNQSTEMSEAQRTAKVQNLKEQIAAGNYNPDIHKVAMSLIQSLIGGK